jgi:hydroxymethylbilane synthase
MTTLRVGTRGSDLALWQTNWVCERLRVAHPLLQIEQVIIKTHGDAVTDKNFGRDWPVGAFVSAIENALTEERIDFAVHSFKDLQTAETAGLTIAATPDREVSHDLLLTRTRMELEDLPDGGRIGTNSPRRAAQLLRLGKFEIVPIRGNVPTRIAKIEREGLDAVVLAAAGVKRLGIEYPYIIELPTDVMVPAPAQGALAIQARRDTEAVELLSLLDDAPTRSAVTAERSFLRRINAGCHTPVGALATVDGNHVSLHARLFSDDYAQVVEGTESGDDPNAVGIALADRLLSELRAKA